jgi:uncharacterized protein involved in type VI secretion and phage assembly
MSNTLGSPVGGPVIGVVSDLDDPQRLGRVRVSFPDLGGVSSDWARVVSAGAGSGRGAFLRPEKGDEVLVAFERGDMRAPYVLGGLWSTSDRPPPDAGDPTENNWRTLTSRSGHVIRLDDTPGRERIELIDKGKRTVVLDAAARRIRVSNPDGDIDVCSPNGTVTVTGKNVMISATESLTLHCDRGLTISGDTVDIN